MCSGFSPESQSHILAKCEDRELITVLGALLPRGGPVQDPVLTPGVPRSYDTPTPLGLPQVPRRITTVGS